MEVGEWLDIGSIGKSELSLKFWTFGIWAVVLLLFIELGNLEMEVGIVWHDDQFLTYWGDGKNSKK